MFLWSGWHAWLGWLSENWLVERMFFASCELIVLTLGVAAAVWLVRPKTPRFVALIWTLVLLKPVVSLFVGAPHYLWEVRLAPANVIEQAQPAEMGAMTWEAAGDRAAIEFGRDTCGVYSCDSGATFDAASLEGPLPHWFRLGADQLLWAWLAGALLMAAKSVHDRWRLRELLRGGYAPAPAVSEIYARILHADSARCGPPLLVSADLESPALVGVVRPTIVLPHWLVDPLHEEGVRWALRHEMMHWRQRDPWLMQVRELAEILFYFHPLVWWAGRRLEESLEVACDRAVVASEDDAKRYAHELVEMLLAVRNRRRRAVAPGLFATRTLLVRRVAALVGGPLRSNPRLTRWAFVALVLLAVGVLGVGMGTRSAGAARQSIVVPSEDESTLVDGDQVLDHPTEQEWNGCG